LVYSVVKVRRELSLLRFYHIQNPVANIFSKFILESLKTGITVILHASSFSEPSSAMCNVIVLCVM